MPVARMRCQVHSGTLCSTVHWWLVPTNDTAPSMFAPYLSLHNRCITQRWCVWCVYWCQVLAMELRPTPGEAGPAFLR